MTSPETVPTDGPRCCQLTCRQVRTEYIASSTPYTVHLHLVTRAVHIFALMLIPFEPDRPTLQFVTPTRVVAAGVGDGNRFCRGPSNQGGMRTEEQPRRTYVAHPDDTVAPHGYWPLTICQLRQYRRNQTSQMPSHPPKMTGGSSPRRRTTPMGRNTWRFRFRLHYSRVYPPRRVRRPVAFAFRFRPSSPVVPGSQLRLGEW